LQGLLRGRTAGQYERHLTLRLAVEHPMQTGEYRTIATPWGVEKGMIDSR
jgi:hypothetical protein